jgi:hypothetical protein
MSCRSTHAGKTISACATAVSHGNSQHVSRLLHALKREAKNQEYTFSPQLADVENLFFSYKNLIMSDSELHPGRRNRVLENIDTAIQKFRNTEERLPNPATFYAWTHIASALEAESRTASSAASTHETQYSTIAKPYHKSFRNFHSKTVEATNELFRKRPSQLSQEQAQEVFQEWIEKVSNNYNISVPQFEWNPEVVDAGGGVYIRSIEKIEMSHTSITTLLHEYRHHMQAKGARMLYEDIEDDARAWSLSLYYKTRPNLFKRLVNEGRILHISAQEL